MKLDTNQIREILVVKNDCTVFEFLGYLSLVASHFGYEPLSRNELVSILNQLASEETPCIKLVIASPAACAQPELCIIRTKPITYFPYFF